MASYYPTFIKAVTKALFMSSLQNEQIHKTDTFINPVEGVPIVKLTRPPLSNAFIKASFRLFKDLF